MDSAKAPEGKRAKHRLWHCLLRRHNWHLWRTPPVEGDLRVCLCCGVVQILAGREGDAWIPYDE